MTSKCEELYSASSYSPTLFPPYKVSSMLLPEIRVTSNAAPLIMLAAIMAHIITIRTCAVDFVRLSCFFAILSSIKSTECC
ncbi:MAG: hypothetical protein L6V82_04130 [Clostridiales bacterium]|nr:MAG: hypothetical protein L6V82_04130 [Clostridiales bacterium]